MFQKWPRLLMAIFKDHNQQMKKLVESEAYAQGTLTHFETTHDHIENFIKWKYSTKDVDIKKDQLRVSGRPRILS